MTGTRPLSRAQSGKRTHQAKRMRRSSSHRPRRLGWRGWLILTTGAVILSLFAWAVLARQFAPTSNTELTHFDAIIVLGAPADADGNPTPTQLARVSEAVREYERGVAPRLIVSGGADRKRAVEARVMARTAEAQGIPKSAIFEEGRARDTIQNGCYSVRIMRSHGWESAEVVSSPSHLPRAGLIFSHLPVEWRTHPAPPMEPSSALESTAVTALETLKTVRYLLWARETETCTP